MTTNQKFLETTTHNIAWVYKRYVANELELSAPFQRNPVWSYAQKSYLIDTILRGYPIPELYIQEFTDANGDDRYVVVDGQQRLRACIEYIGNEFPLSSSGKQKILLEGKSFNDLEDHEKRAIYNYNFIVRKLPDLSDTEIRAVFSRINRNTVALNEQELRHSTYWGQFIRTMETVSKFPKWQQVGIFSANDIRRMLDVEYVSELTLAYLHGPQNKKSTLDKWYAAYEDSFEESTEMLKVFRQALAEITTALPNIRGTRFSKKSDFYTLFQLFTTGRALIEESTFQQLNEKLTKFASMVNAYIDNPANDLLPPIYVRSYAGAVERAASDLGNRRRRFDALSDAIKQP